MKCVECNHRGKIACTNQKCYKCCSKDISNICEVHKEELNRKTDEERYIQEAVELSHAPKKRKLFVHEESKFTDFNQTIVIWCLKDFCQNKGMSAATFAQLDRAKSFNAVRRKRNLGKAGSKAPRKEIDDMTRIRRNLEAHTKKRNSKYSLLKCQWDKNLKEQDRNNNSTLWLMKQVSH